MVDLDIKPDMVPVSEFHDPVKIRPEDFDSVRTIQASIDALNKYRMEMGRLYQVLGNLLTNANEAEKLSAEKRRELVAKYGLEAIGTGQWAIDFEKKEFVRLSDKAPAIP